LLYIKLAARRLAFYLPIWLKVFHLGELKRLGSDFAEFSLEAADDGVLIVELLPQIFGFL
jgi:hypothetical protein